MKKIYLSLFLFAAVYGCRIEQKNADTALDAEIAALDTPHKLADYYEAVRNADQSVRTAEQQALQQFGYESPQYKAAYETMRQTDRTNIRKIEKLYALYGYPTVNTLGDAAASAPWLVIHHADLEPRRRNWPMMREGYKVGAIDDNAMSMYLNRTYAMQNSGQRLRMQGKFKPKDEIDSLLKLLNLRIAE